MVKERTLLFLFFLVFLAATALFATAGCSGGSGNSVAPLASGGTTAPTSPVTGQGGTVQGIVYDSESEAPLEGALVSIGSTTATSNQAGEYALTGIAAGSQAVRVSRKDYQDLSETVQVAEGQETDVDLFLDTTIDIWLDLASDYRWQVEAVKADGSTVPGPVWSFTTISQARNALKSVPGPVDGGQASRVALAFLRGEGKESLELSGSLPLTGRNGIRLAWLITLKPAGYLAVPASSAGALPPVLAYSFDRVADLRDPAFQKRLRLIRQDVEMRLAAMGEKDSLAAETISSNRALWQAALKGTSVPRAGRAPTGPVLQTTWNQFDPYNKYCPVDPESKEKERCITGCVATAYGQIMNHWSRPKSIVFEPASSYSYTTRKRGIAIDASTAGIPSINWNSAQTDTDTIARVCFALGVIGQMNYTSDISTSNTFIFGKAIKGFGYENVTLKTFSPGDTFTTDLLDSDLKSRHPVAMRLNKQDESGDLYGGHCVVCDGIDEAGSTKYYHFNMGRYDRKGNDWYSLPSGLPLKYSVVGGYVCNIVPVNKRSSGARRAQAALPQNPFPSDGSKGFDVNEALLWDEVDDAATYNCFVWKADQSRPAVPTFSDLPYGGASSEFLRQ